MRRWFLLLVAALIGTAAEAVTFPFPTDNTLFHTATFDGTVGQANAAGIGASQTGDYIEASLFLPQPVTFNTYSFTAPLINYNLSSTALFNILLNGTSIGSFSVNPLDAQAGSVSGADYFGDRTVVGQSTLRILLTNNVTGAVGAGTNGQFTLSVPEPGTWALTIVGFGVAGWSMRRRPRGGLAPRA